MTTNYFEIGHSKKMKQKIEIPMNMNYREAYAWQLGYDMGWKQALENKTKESEESKILDKVWEGKNE